MKINPVFDDLNNPATILNHVEQLKGKSEAAIPHAEILQQLIKQFEPLDFEVLAFPQVKKLREQLERLPTDSEQAKDIRKELDKIKVNTKHYRILSIKNVSKTATKNRWGLCKTTILFTCTTVHFGLKLTKTNFKSF